MCIGVSSTTARTQTCSNCAGSETVLRFLVDEHFIKIAHPIDRRWDAPKFIHPDESGAARGEKRDYNPCGSGVQTQLAVKNPKIKLQANMPPQKKGVTLMVITPLKASDGTRINPASKASPSDFVKVGCFFIMKQHNGVR
jgi:hypothetical protein